MKKLLLSFALVLTTINTMAQEWKSEEVAADAVKGIEAHTRYTYQVDSICYMTIKDTGSEWSLTNNVRGNCYAMKIGAFKRNFKETRGRCTIAFLDADKNIVGRLLEDTSATNTNSFRTIGSGKYTDQEAALIPQYLRDNTGYVRIIIPMYLGGDTDVTIPCIHNQK